MTEEDATVVWVGECDTCGAVYEREDEADVRDTMQRHAEQLDHVYSVTRGERGGKLPLYCPECVGRFFAIVYDEASDSLTLTCQECDHEETFQGAMGKLREENRL